MSLEKDLCRSILSGNISNIESLISEGADVNINHASETASTRAIIVGIQNVIDAILYSTGFDVNAGNGDDRTPLFIAAEYGRLDVVKQLVSLGADINKSDYRKTTPLMIATRVGNNQIAKYLIEQGADLERESFNGETALYIACDKVNVEIVEILLSRNVEINVQTNQRHSNPGYTPLFVSVPSPYELQVKNQKKSNMLKIMRLLVQKGCNLNTIDQRGNTALHIAANLSDVHTVCILAESGTNLQTRNIYGETAFDIALQKKASGLSMAICLLLYGIHIDDAEYARTVFKAILDIYLSGPSNESLFENNYMYQHRLLFDLLLKDIPHLFELFKSCISIEECNLHLLEHLTFISCHPESLAGHCRRTVRRSITSQLLQGINSLPIAKSLKVYVALDYDFISNDPVRTCDLLLAIKEGDAKSIQGLVQSGLCLDASILDYTPLTYAASLGNLDAVGTLLQNGANAVAFDNRGNSPIHEAATVGSLEILDTLLQYECDINMVNAEGETPVLKSALNGKFMAMRYLIERGAECLMCNKNGRYLIHYAAASGHYSACTTLLEHGVPVNQRETSGNTPLHLAASSGLLYTGNNIDLPALFPSETAMHLDSIRNVFGKKPSKLFFCDDKNGVSAECSHEGVVLLLLDSGADKMALNGEGKTPIDIAKQFDQAGIADVLNSY